MTCSLIISPKMARFEKLFEPTILHSSIVSTFAKVFHFFHSLIGKYKFVTFHQLTRSTRRLRLFNVSRSSSGKSPETPKIKTSKIPGPKHKQTHTRPWRHSASGLYYLDPRPLTSGATLLDDFPWEPESLIRASKGLESCRSNEIQTF